MVIFMCAFTYRVGTCIGVCVCVCVRACVRVCVRVCGGDRTLNISLTPPRCDPWAVFVNLYKYWLKSTVSLDYCVNEHRTSLDGVTRYIPCSCTCRELAILLQGKTHHHAHNIEQRERCYRHGD